MSPKSSRPRVVAVASGGGHWVQLQRLRPAFDRVDVTYITTRSDLRADVPDRPFRLVPEANRWQKWNLIRCAVAMSRALAVERPDIVVTTGAAPGYIAIRLGKLLGARTIWIDSVANADELSMSGRRALKRADVYITQWEHLAKSDGPLYYGSVFG